MTQVRTKAQLLEDFAGRQTEQIKLQNLIETMFALQFSVSVDLLGLVPNVSGEAADNSAKLSDAIADGVQNFILPPERFYLTNVPLSAPISIQGTLGASILSLPLGSTDIMFSSAAAGASAYFKGLTFSDDETTVQTGTHRTILSSTHDSMSVLFDLCDFLGLSGIGIKMVGNTLTDVRERLSVTRCRFIDGVEANLADASSAKNIVAFSGTDLWVEGNQHLQPTPAVAYGRTAITMGDPGVLGRYDRCTITNNDIRGCGKLQSDGGGLLGAVDCHEFLEDSFIGFNRFEDVVSSAARWKTDARNLLVAFNAVKGVTGAVGTGAIAMTPAPTNFVEGFTTIIGNVLSGGNQIGIALVGDVNDGSFGKVIAQDNSISDFGAEGIRVRDLIHCDVSNNPIDGVKTYGISTLNLDGDCSFNNNKIRNVTPVAAEASYGIDLNAKTSASLHLTVNGNQGDTIYRSLIRVGLPIKTLLAHGNKATNVTAVGGFQNLLTLGNSATADFVSVQGNYLDTGTGVLNNGTVTKLIELNNSWQSARTIATVADYRAATAGAVLTADIVFSAAALVALTDASTVPLDFSDGLNFSLSIAGARTLGNPSNTKVGQAGLILITQADTGSHTLAYSSNWKFVGGVAPVLTTTAAAVDILHYFVEDSTHIRAWLSPDSK